MVFFSVLLVFRIIRMLFGSKFVRIILLNSCDSFLGFVVLIRCFLYVYYFLIGICLFSFLFIIIVWFCVFIDLVGVRIVVFGLVGV